MSAALFMSLALNGALLAVAAVFLKRKGGFAYLKAKLAAKGVIRDKALERFEGAYYRTRTELFAEGAIGPGDTVMLGDSLTDACPWHELFQDPRFKNRGISGDTAEGVLARVGGVVKGRPTRVCLLVGINDLNNGVAPEVLLGTYGKILTALQGAGPGTRIVVQSLLPVDTLFWGLAIGETIERFNRELAGLAAEFGCEFLDLHALFLHEGRLDPACTYDGLHLNGAGYARWREALLLLLPAGEGGGQAGRGEGPGHLPGEPMA